MRGGRGGRGLKHGGLFEGFFYLDGLYGVLRGLGLCYAIPTLKAIIPDNIHTTGDHTRD